VASDDRRVSALDRFFASYYRLRPVNATFTGIHDFDHLLPDWSPEGLSAARHEMSDLRRELAAAGLGVLDREAIESRDWVAIDGALADSFLEIELAELSTLRFQRGNLSLAIGEALFGVIALMTRRFDSIEVRGANAAVRLRAFPLFLVGVRRTLEDVTILDGWRERVLRECDGGQLLLNQIEAWLEAENAPASIRADARVGVAVARESLAWFRSLTLSLPVPTVHDTHYAAGPPFLDALLRRGHWVDASQTSLRWEAREAFEAELERLRQTIEHAGARDWREVQERLAGRHPTTEGFAQAFEDTWQACRALAEERNLVTWPERPVRYVPMPPWTQEAASRLYYLFYRSPAPFDDAPETESMIAPVDTLPDDKARDALLRSWNDSVIKLNHVVHHGAIGHHVQNWHARRAPSRIGQIAAVDCANRIGMFCGGTMAEGWACYATDLMEEADFFTPLERVAQQHTRLRLLARAIVDLELHGGRMTFDDAVAIYTDAIGLSLTAARAEVVKTSMFPGTAVMYWLGTRTIKQLREARQQALGSAFSLRDFHDELLSFGSIPIALGAKLMTHI
jgi:hypothetical protein